MDTIFKLMVSATFATGFSVICTVLYFAACFSLIEFAKYNYGNENYWVFGHCFIVLIVSWILSFGYFAATIKDVS